ncbi:GMC oxidoreductase [Pseudaestuariivita atlantica]|uniref:Glucose-methanol-choline oxidoreductase n=1 Tax=Pseudaestuariivita atlantica TaxID=1317121 RepID=A0A0L1JPA4_9RHOB|nr:GMC family oxidoreductase [Pseudaestuariivita atlantica]KNG93542.1 glucose-methanol-choline oxidoreductase [Pseudaestuariivita atlantica]
MSAELFSRDWDVVVIGTGMGGGTMGRALAEAGLKVLFVEKGPAGHRTEEQAIDPGIFDPQARLLRGAWPGQMQATIDGRASRFHGPVGAGLGGSSVFYAATLERPERHDLDASNTRPHPTGGWPVSFDAFLPWFDAAQRMYHVAGGDDPLSDIPHAVAEAHPMGAGDAAMADSFRRSGLHPYALHSAVRHLPGCRDCLGHKCPRPCKMDGRSAGVEPALATGNAALATRTEAVRFEGQEAAISGLVVRHDGAEHVIRARRYVLAGGAFGSPRLLFNSASEAWPEGCANGAGQVGRHLMFHLNEMLAIWPRRGEAFAGPSKAIGLRDLYHRDDQRFGMVQAMGIEASYGDIVHVLNGMYDRSALARFRQLRHLTRIPAAIAARVLGEAKVFVGLMEDLPYADNRVLPSPADDPDALRFTYSLRPELLSRRRAFRRAMKRAFRAHRTLFLTRTPELNFGHGCGTLRFGTDPATSVLRPDCRAHEVANLYVADASFMPTSAGVNPSLTIAANALRVADHLAKDMAHDP